jgi:hypothetical protein
MFRTTNSWGTAKSKTYDGYVYMSGFEAKYAQELDLRLKAKEIASWERQVKIPLIVNGYLIANYYIDFIIHHLDGKTEYAETKGFATDVWKMKWKIFEALYGDKPDVKLSVIYQGKGKAPKPRRIKSIR